MVAKKKAAKKSKTTADRLRELKQGYNTFKEALPEIGESAEAPNGLGALAERVGSATVLDDDMEVVVTASGSIYKGDMVALTKELCRKGDPLRIANGDAVMLGAVSMGDAVVVLFAQDDDTFLKTARWNGTVWILGSTKTFCEGPLDKAVMVPYWTDVDKSGVSYLAVFYFESEIGMVQFWSISGAVLTHHGTDIWTDQKLVNLCGAWNQKRYLYVRGTGGTQCYLTVIGQDSSGQIVVTGIRPVWQWNEEERKNYLTARIEAAKTIEPGAYTGADYSGNDYIGSGELFGGKLDDFTVPAASTEEYENGAAWRLMGKNGSVLLIYPGVDGKRYLLDLWFTIDSRFSPVREYTYEPGALRAMMLEGTMPCGAEVPYILGAEGQGSHSSVIFTGLARTSGPNQKSLLGVEVWSDGYSSTMLPLWFGSEDQIYQNSLGLISAALLGKDEKLAAVGYSAEGKYRAILFYYQGSKHGHDLIGGPTVELCEVGTAAALVKSSTGAALVYQKNDSIYIQQCAVAEVAAQAGDSNAADAVAVTGGRAGQTIKIRSI